MNLKEIDFSKCLDELEHTDWGEAPLHSTGLIIKAHELRKLPLQLWTNEDLRLMILQQISLEYLIPIALYRLAKNPFSSGDLFVGDLLSTVVRVEGDFWRENGKLHYELDSLIDSLRLDIETLTDIVSEYKLGYQ